MLFYMDAGLPPNETAPFKALTKSTLCQWSESQPGKGWDFYVRGLCPRSEIASQPDSPAQAPATCADVRPRPRIPLPAALRTGVEITADI